MANIDQQAQRVARAQHGLASRRQLAEVGVGQRAIHRRTSRGIWTVRFGTVIDLGTHPASDRQSLMAALLAAGPTALVYRHSAAAVHGFLDARLPATPEVVVARGRERHLEGVAVHSSTSLTAADVVHRHGFAVTSVGRTLFDLARCTEARQLEVWVWDLARRDPSVLAELASDLARRPGAPGSRRLASVLSGVRPDLGLAESPLEIHGLLALRDVGAPRPQLQFVVRDRRGRFVARVDAAWPEARVIVEFDGAAFHQGEQACTADAVRRARLRELGWHVIALTVEDLRRPARLRRLVVDELRIRSAATPAEPLATP